MPAERDTPFTAIVLAAQRASRIDPLAIEAGVSHKCLVPILGRPMVHYVLEALALVPGLERIRICIEPEAVEAVRPVVEAAAGAVRVEFVPSAATITESCYVSASGLDGPILITTADNVNLTPGAVRRCLDPILTGAEVTIALATREAVLTARSEENLQPASIARVGPYRFADGRYSNCNLYALAGPGVLRITETFREGGQFSKSLRRLLTFIGLFNVLLYFLRVLTLRQAMKRLSRRFGVRIEPVVLEDGAHAVDVDNARTYRIAEAILMRKMRKAQA